MLHSMTYEFKYEFMYMKNIVKSYLKSGVTKFPDAAAWRQAVAARPGRATLRRVSGFRRLQVVHRTTGPRLPTPHRVPTAASHSETLAT